MKKLRLFVIVLSSMFSQVSFAADTYLGAVPATSLRLQNYAPDNVMVWWTTASQCNGGGLGSNNLSANDKNRLYATILSAKLANHTVYFFYDANCQITSFGVDN